MKRIVLSIFLLGLFCSNVNGMNNGNEGIRFDIEEVAPRIVKHFYKMHACDIDLVCGAWFEYDGIMKNLRESPTSSSYGRNYDFTSIIRDLFRCIEVFSEQESLEVAVLALKSALDVIFLKNGLFYCSIKRDSIDREMGGMSCQDTVIRYIRYSGWKDNSLRACFKQFEHEHSSENGKACYDVERYDCCKDYLRLLSAHIAYIDKLFFCFCIQCRGREIKYLYDEYKRSLRSIILESREMYREQPCVYDDNYKSIQDIQDYFWGVIKSNDIFLRKILSVDEGKRFLMLFRNEMMERYNIGREGEFAPNYWKGFDENMKEYFSETDKYSLN